MWRLASISAALVWGHSPERRLGTKAIYVEFDFYRFLFSILDTTMEESLRVREGHLKGSITYSLGEVRHAKLYFSEVFV